MDSGTYLTREQLKSILGDGNQKSEKKDLDTPREIGDLVFIKNDKYDELDVLNNTKPFYKAVILEDQGDKFHFKLDQNEECKEPKFLKPFSHPKNLVLDFSDAANTGLADMIDIDELNHATIMHNLFVRF